MRIVCTLFYAIENLKTHKWKTAQGVSNTHYWWLLLVFIWEFWKVFQNTSFMSTLLFYEQVAEFQPPDTVNLRPATLLKRETLAQVFSCEFCKISKNTFCYRTPLVAASVLLSKRLWSVQAQFLSAESSITCNWPVQSRFI